MHSRDSVRFVKRLLERVDVDGLVLVPIRPKALNDEEAFVGDYDFLASEEAIIPLLQTLFDMAAAECLNFTVNQTKFGKTKLSIYDSVDSRSITVEIWTHLEVKERGCLRYIFYEDIEPHIRKEPCGAYAFGPEIEALYYLSHLKTKSKNLVAVEVQARLAYYKATVQDQVDLVALYERLQRDTTLRDEIATCANHILMEKCILFCKRNTEKRARAFRRYRAAKQWRLYSRWLRLLRITPVLGPDGVGKTSLIKALKRKTRSRVYYYRFKKLFRHNWIYQFSRAVLKRRLPKTFQKNQYDDIYGKWLLTIARFRYPLLVVLSLVTRRFYFCDRFFHDLLIENARFQHKEAGLRSNWEHLLRKTPGTFWLIQLDAPNTVILSRKQELTEQAIDAYRSSIFEMYLEKPSVVYSYVSTALPLEQCSAALTHSAASLGVKPL